VQSRADLFVRAPFQIKQADDLSLSRRQPPKQTLDFFQRFQTSGGHRPIGRDRHLGLGRDALRRLELRAPLSGRVIVRSAISGGAAAAEAELFTIADLSTLWVEMTIPPRDLHLAQEGRTVAIRDGEMRGVGRIAFLSPLLDPETRAARAVAEVGNLEGNWRPGAFVIAELTSAEQPVDVSIPRSAVQDVAGQKVVFLRTAEGFERREVVLGREDSLSFEILSGLEAGMEIAIENTFVLKAAFGKSEASHSH